MTDTELLTAILATLESILVALEVVRFLLVSVLYGVVLSAAALGFQVILYAARNKNLWG